MKKFLAKYWIYIAAAVVGIALTPGAVRYAAVERGYSGAFGGEYLLVPLCLLIATLIDGIAKMAVEVCQEVKDDELTRRD